MDFEHYLDDRLAGGERLFLLISSLAKCSDKGREQLADTLRDEWGIQPREVVVLLSEKPRDVRSHILRSMLSGPIER